MPNRRDWMRVGFCAAVALGLAPTATPAEDWPQFRGVNASGVSTSKGLPTEFSHTDKVAWLAELGDGVSCPIVFAGRVYNTGMTGATTLTVFSHDAATGKEIWRRDVETGKLPRITPPNSHASSTPCCDGKRVYVHFSTLGLMAFDVADGKEVWRHPLPLPAYLMDWGAATSPIVYKDTVLFCQDDDLNPFLLCLDSATGKEKWKTLRSDMLAGYAVPVICEVDGQTDVVVAGSGMMKGYDPATGEERWTCNTMLRTIMTTPVVKDGVIYVSVQSYGDSTRTLKFALLEWLDTNQDGKLVRDEIPKEFHSRFDVSDKDKNGALEGAELDTAFQSPNNQVGGGNIIQAIKGGGKGDVTRTHVLWNLNNRAPSNLASPLVVNDQLFVVKKGGISSSFHIAEGKPNWELKRIGNLGDYYSSPVAADGKIFVTGENGFLVVLEEGPEMKILAKNDMGGSCVATPAIADGRIFVRTREKIFCISNEK